MGVFLLGGALAVIGLGWVLLPILRGEVAGGPVHIANDDAVEPSALDALREIEFDEATGKLAPEDYARLRAEYMPLAVAELRAQGAANDAATAGAGPPDDRAEQLIARARARSAVCPVHGPRPEPDALFCSECGEPLAA